MSSHFSANQPRSLIVPASVGGKPLLEYENAFIPNKLQNYQVPAEHNERPSARTSITKTITNDSGHILDSKYRSSDPPWGSFVGTWQAERKPLLLKTTCELEESMGNTRYVENTGQKGPASSSGSNLDTNRKTEKRNAEISSDTGSKSGSKVNTPILVESPCHSSREHEMASDNTKTESEKIKECESKSTSQSGSAQGSRPESRMAHQNVQSPLGFRPPSTISEVSQKI